MKTFAELAAGEPAPGFVQRCSNNPRFVFDSAAGRLLVLCLFGSGGEAHARAAIAAVEERADLFNDRRAAFFGVSMDPQDEAGRLRQRLPGYRYFWDQDGAIGRLYGALPAEFWPADGWAALRARWVLVDRSLRVLAVVPFSADLADIPRVLALVEQETQPQALARRAAPAPVLILPRVFPPELCRELLDLHAQEEKARTGFMVEERGLTVMRQDRSHKRRQDVVIAQEAVRKRLRDQVCAKILPQIEKAFQFRATRIERYLIGCYTDRDRGMFGAHRDNTTRGTAHRRFAVSVLLNEDYAGGELRFAEFGDTLYRPPAGGAAVFSCSLLHEVLPVTSGQRFVFLPFLYDEAAAKIREQNLRYIRTPGTDAGGPSGPSSGRTEP